MVPKFDEFRSKLNVMMMQEVAILKCNHDQCILCHVESDIPAIVLLNVDGLLNLIPSQFLVSS